MFTRPGTTTQSVASNTSSAPGQSLSTVPMRVTNAVLGEDRRAAELGPGGVPAPQIAAADQEAHGHFSAWRSLAEALAARRLRRSEPKRLSPAPAPGGRPALRRRRDPDRRLRLGPGIDLAGRFAPTSSNEYLGERGVPPGRSCVRGAHDELRARGGAAGEIARPGPQDVVAMSPAVGRLRGGAAAVVAPEAVVVHPAVIGAERALAAPRPIRSPGEYLGAARQCPGGQVRVVAGVRPGLPPTCPAEW